MASVHICHLYPEVRELRSDSVFSIRKRCISKYKQQLDPFLSYAFSWGKKQNKQMTRSLNHHSVFSPSLEMMPSLMALYFLDSTVLCQFDNTTGAGFSLFIHNSCNCLPLLDPDAKVQSTLANSLATKLMKEESDFLNRDN